MKDSLTDKVEGAIHEAKGTVKETIGQVTNDAELEEEGKSENLAGKIQTKVGEVKQVFNK
jgi:uncharacterized protein YjbJ (UPF0337 family)